MITDGPIKTEQTKLAQIGLPDYIVGSFVVAVVILALLGYI
jgi:hypothetical protein